MASFENCFKGKRFLVTGAGKGIGRALVTKLNDLGAVIYAVSRTQADLDSLTTGCPNIHAITLDVSDWENTKKTLNEVLTEPVDILVNNAGVDIQQAFLKITSDTFDNIVSVNLKALVNISQICAEKMIGSKVAGTIINISSVHGIKPVQASPVYSATKAGVDSLTKTMSMELGKHQIKVVAMNFGWTWTNLWVKMTGSDDKEAAEKSIAAQYGHQFPLGKMFIPTDQMINSILFVASGSVDMMTGNGFLVDAGFCAN